MSRSEASAEGLQLSLCPAPTPGPAPCGQGTCSAGQRRPWRGSGCSEHSEMTVSSLTESRPLFPPETERCGVSLAAGPPIISRSSIWGERKAVFSENRPFSDFNPTSFQLLLFPPPSTLPHFLNYLQHTVGYFYCQKHPENSSSPFITQFGCPTAPSPDHLAPTPLSQCLPLGVGISLFPSTWSPSTWRTR